MEQSFSLLLVVGAGTTVRVCVAARERERERANVSLELLCNECIFMNQDEMADRWRVCVCRSRQTIALRVGRIEFA